MIRAIAQELLLRALEEAGVLAHLDLLDQLRRGNFVSPIPDPQTDQDRKWNEFAALHLRPAPERPRRLWLGVPRLGWEPSLSPFSIAAWRIEGSAGPDRWSVAIGRLLLMFGPDDVAHALEAMQRLRDIAECTTGCCVGRLEDAADRAYGRYARAVGGLAVGGSRMPVVPNARVRRAWVEAIRGALELPPGVAPGELAPPQDGSRAGGAG